MHKAFLRLAAVMVGVVLVGFACREQMPDKATRSLSVYPTGIRGEPTIRVLAVDAADRLTLSVTGAFSLSVKYPDGREQTGGGSEAVSVQVEPTAQGVKLGKDAYVWATVKPLDGAKVLINNRRYPGSLTFRSAETHLAGKAVHVLRVIVNLGIEQYLAGVLPNEMQANWPLEALRAQAVAARTYALYHIKTRMKKDWDVKSSVASQVWKPGGNRHPRVNMAVNSTAGVVLTENWRLFPAFYHSQCGGRTASGNPVLVREDITALTGVRCPLCAESGEPLSKWRLTISKEALSLRLRTKNMVVGAVKSIRLLGRDRRVASSSRMERVYFMELIGAGGAVQTVNANDFRIAVGGGRGQLESTWFSLAESSDKKAFVFEGYGFGHGVGMCQYGAKYLAERKGYTYQAILSHYYVGIKLARLWGK